MAKSNHHAYVVPVVLEPHPDPETTRLSIVSVNAYTCVVATEDWQGVTKAVYIQPDTVVPDWPEFAYLKRNNSARAELAKEFTSPLGNPGTVGVHTAESEQYKLRLQQIEEKEAANTKNLRITAKRLRGVQSFGMLWPTTECHLCDEGVPLLVDGTSHFFDGVGELPCIKTAKIGDDLWDSLFLKRYEPPLPAEAGAEADTPPDISWDHVYDLENYYNYPNVLQPGEEVVIWEKLDGANARFVYAEDRVTGEYRQFVGGREEWKKSTGGLLWTAFKHNSWIGEFCKAHPDWIVYGEVFGNVQKLKYGVKPNQPNFIRIFDVLAVNKFLDVPDLKGYFTKEQLAPIVYEGPWDAEKAIALSEGKSTMADHNREGVVICPVKDRHDRALGRVKLKIVSFEHLAKGK